MKNQILDTIKELELDFQSEAYDTHDNLKSLCYELERQSIIGFNVEENADEGYRIEYYSLALGKTIIWDYDAQIFFDDAESVADYVKENDEQIKAFELSLARFKR